MKHINKFLVMLLSVFALVSCESDLEMQKVADKVGAPQLYPYGQSIVITEDNAETTTTFAWSPANFGYSAAVNYSLIIQVGDGEKKLVGSTFANYLEVKLKDLNAAAVEAGAPTAVAASASLTLIASISDSYETVSSAPVTVTITTLTALPEALHIIGNVLGSQEWNNANYEYVMFRDNNLAVNTYTTKFKAGGFKFILNENLGSWDNLYGEAGAGVLGNKTGGDITGINADGYYTVTTDLKALTYTITPYDASAASTYSAISLIGEFNGWNGDDGSELDLIPTDYDPHIWILDTVELPAGELKFRVGHDWATSWGGGEAFPYGIGTGDNLKVPEAGTYFVKFNDLTKHYVFHKK
ncbi:MAG: SusE domain-containing protein [Candidatus Symbiothrix sp.]|jgi:hypothetical protein|nr:SusE domain-containing protein [Candidatus Symbiothrix sp.]